MFGVDDVLMGAAISGIGSGITSLFNMNSTEKTNEANAAQAQLNRDFQERMSNTAYQRGMADMKAAGLNPILAYQKGPASSPSGSQAALTAPKIEGNPVGEALNTGLAVRRAHQELTNMQETQRNINADTYLKTSQTATNTAQRMLAEAELPPKQREAMKAEIDKEVYGTSAQKLLRKTGTIAEEADRAVSPVVNNASKVLHAVSPFKSYEVTRSGTRWNNKGEENHYQESTFNNRFKGW